MLLIAKSTTKWYFVNQLQFAFFISKHDSKSIVFKILVHSSIIGVRSSGNVGFPDENRDSVDFIDIRNKSG